MLNMVLVIHKSVHKCTGGINEDIFKGVGAVLLYLFYFLRK